MIFWSYRCSLMYMCTRYLGNKVNSEASLEDILTGHFVNYYVMEQIAVSIIIIIRIPVKQLTKCAAWRRGYAYPLIGMRKETAWSFSIFFLLMVVTDKNAKLIFVLGFLSGQYLMVSQPMVFQSWAKVWLLLARAVQTCCFRPRKARVGTPWCLWHYDTT